MEMGRVESVDTKESLERNIRELCSKLKALDPSAIHCMMGTTVVKAPTSEAPDNVVVNVFAVGDDKDIAQMFAAMARVVQSGIIQLNAPDDHSKEVKH